MEVRRRSDDVGRVEDSPSVDTPRGRNPRDDEQEQADSDAEVQGDVPGLVGPSTEAGLLALFSDEPDSGDVEGGKDLRGVRLEIDCTETRSH